MTRKQVRAVLWVTGAVIYGLIPQQTREVFLMVAGAAFISLLFICWLCSLDDPQRGGERDGKKAPQASATLPPYDAE